MMGMKLGVVLGLGLEGVTDMPEWDFMNGQWRREKDEGEQENESMKDRVAKDDM